MSNSDPFVILDKVGRKFDLFLMSKIISFFKEVKEELDKVAWPSREQTIRYTILVILVTLVSGGVLGGLDYLLTLLTTFLINQT